MRQESLQFWDLLRLILESLRYGVCVCVKYRWLIVICYYIQPQWKHTFGYIPLDLQYCHTHTHTYTHTHAHLFNSLSPGWCSFNLVCVISKCVLVITFLNITSAIAFRWMGKGPTDDMSTLVQAMAWCHQVTSHCLKQCWLSSMPPYSVIRSQWVNLISVLISHTYIHTT